MFYKRLKRGTGFFVGVFLAFSLLAGQNFLEAASLHAILVADTTDSSIGSSTEVDLQNMRKHIQKIAFYTGMPLKESTFSGKEVIPEKVLEEISALDVKEDDTVIFYFSGHGFRTASKGENPWPNLYFSRSSNGIEFDFIGKKLEGFHPRLLIVAADVCNNIIPDSCAPPVIRKMCFKSRVRVCPESNYKRLFLEPKGVLMMTSSKAGEYSWATERGGLFTLAFLQHLVKELKTAKNPNWFTILDNAAQQVRKDQHPEFRIFLDP